MITPPIPCSPPGELPLTEPGRPREASTADDAQILLEHVIRPVRTRKWNEILDHQAALFAEFERASKHHWLNMSMIVSTIPANSRGVILLKIVTDRGPFPVSPSNGLISSLCFTTARKSSSTLV